METSAKAYNYSSLNEIGNNLHNYIDKIRHRGFISSEKQNEIKNAVNESYRKFVESITSPDMKYFSNCVKTKTKLERKVSRYIEYRDQLLSRHRYSTFTPLNPVSPPALPRIPSIPRYETTSYVPPFIPMTSSTPLYPLPPAPSIPPHGMTSYLPPFIPITSSTPLYPSSMPYGTSPFLPAYGTMPSPFPLMSYGTPSFLSPATSLPYGTMPTTTTSTTTYTAPDSRKRRYADLTSGEKEAPVEDFKRKKYIVPDEERNETIAKIMKVRAQYLGDSLEGELIRLSSHSEELQSQISSSLLNNMRHVFQRDQQRLYKTQDPRLNWNLSAQQVKNIQVMVGRALELQKALPDQYLLLHAQSSAWLCVGMLMKEIFKLKYPHLDAQCFKLLRWPFVSGDSVVNPFEPVDDHEEGTRERLISADMYLLNHSAFESYLDMLVKNLSVAGGPQIVRLFLTKFLSEKVGLDRMVDPKPFVDEIMSVVEQGPKSGNLFAYIIPKKTCEALQNKILYPSHPYGQLCMCHLQEKQWERMDTLQKNGNLANDVLCNTQLLDKTNRQIPAVPQVRIQAFNATPSRGCCVVRLTPFDLQDYKKALRECVKAVAQKLAPHMNIQ